MTRTGRNPQEFGKVAVLMGGWSPEREVSLVSGKAVLEALQRQGIDAHGIDVDRKTLLGLKSSGYDRAFNILHGAGGEDGVVQGVLQVLGLPGTGSGLLASALSMDKRCTKLIWAAQGIPTPMHVVLTDETDFGLVADELDLPIFVKPATAGSSIGLTKVIAVEQFKDAYDFARQYDSVVLAERFVKGGEYTCAILGDQPLPLIRIVPEGDFYDYKAKYVSDNTRYHCPSGLPTDVEQELQAMALRAFQLLGASGWGRIDFLLDDESRPWFLELNTVPGMTSHSLVPMAAKAAGISFDELVCRVLETTFDKGGA